jgi:hypothetical protein
VKTKAVTDLSQSTYKQQTEISIFQAELDNWKLSMPNYKLISYRSIDKLCAKYGLLMGLSTLYKETLPTKNAYDVQQFVKKYTGSTRWAHTNTVDPLFTQAFDDYGKNGKNNLYVVGAEKFFDLKGQVVVGREIFRSPADGAKYTLEPIPVPPDPIILAPAYFNSKFGRSLKLFTIITAFGIEASDPMVVNEKMN